MENTIENRGKYISQYWYQQVFRYTTVDERSPQSQNAYVDHYSLTPTIMLEFGYIQLKPLNELTEVEAEMVRKLQGHIKCELSIHFDLSDEFMVCIQSKHNDNYEVVNINTIDYLRSRGYALPYMGLSIEKLIEYGWLKIKNNI